MIVRNKVFLCAGVFIFAILASVGYAVWSYYTNQSFDVSVSSDGSPLSWTMEFTDLDFNTSIDEVTINNTATLFNADGNFEMVLNTFINTTPTDAGCQDYENDCNATFYWNNTEVGNNSNVPIVPGEQNLTTSLYCRQHSCPMNMHIEVELATIIT